MAKETDSNTSQEIDLIEVFSKLVKGLKDLILQLIRGLLFLIVFGFRKIYLLIGFAIVGGVFGWLLFSGTQRHFSSYMIAQANGNTSADMINYINDLHVLCQKKNTKALAYSLEINDTSAVKIKDIEAFFIIDVNKDGIGDQIDFKHAFSLKDTTQKRLEDRFYVSVEVSDNTSFSVVKKGLYNYMGRNPYIIMLNEIRKKELTELIRQTENEIAKLDSLQRIDYFHNTHPQPVSQSDLMFIAEKEKRMYYRDIIRLVEEKQEYLKEYELSTGTFTVIKDFTNLALAENTWRSYVKKYALLSTLAGFILLLFLKYREKLMKFIIVD